MAPDIPSKGSTTLVTTSQCGCAPLRSSYTLTSPSLSATAAIIPLWFPGYATANGSPCCEVMGSLGTSIGLQCQVLCCKSSEGHLAKVPEPAATIKPSVVHAAPRTTPSVSKPSKETFCAFAAPRPAAAGPGISAPKPLAVKAATCPPAEAGPQERISGSKNCGQSTAAGTTGRVVSATGRVRKRRQCASASGWKPKRSEGQISWRPEGPYPSSKKKCPRIGVTCA
mmetsp:Transcript_47060/g.86251  ORF Transcript_47060/g.86251 Transcript_47060/m.86251 type:complete len:226 (-) Transcript_47060:1624-2301(-)